MSSTLLSAKLRYAGNVGVDRDDSPSESKLLFELADRAAVIEKFGDSPLLERDWGMVFCRAEIFASEIIREYESRQ